MISGLIRCAEERGLNCWRLAANISSTRLFAASRHCTLLRESTWSSSCTPWLTRPRHLACCIGEFAEPRRSCPRCLTVCAGISSRATCS